MPADYGKYLRRAEGVILNNLLPDTCTIKTVQEAPVIDERGVLTRPYVDVLYNDSPDIPCRIDPSRSFRPERLPAQEINANEYVLHLPTTVFVKPNDKITIIREGHVHRFEVRKLTAMSNWRVTNEALIVELEGQYESD